MINHQYTLERGRQADQSRSMSTPSIKTGDLPRKDKVCLQPVKTNIVISYNIYDFDWYVQVTSFVCFKNPTARDNKQKRRKLYCWRCWRRWRLIKTILACSKSAKTVSSLELTLICLGQKQKLLSGNLSQILWQLVYGKNTKKTISDLSVHKLIHKYAFGQIVTHHVYVVQAKTKKPILSVMENSFLFWND